MMFADDMAICAPEKEEAEKQVEEWRKALEDRYESEPAKN